MEVFREDEKIKKADIRAGHPRGYGGTLRGVRGVHGVYRQSAARIKYDTRRFTFQSRGAAAKTVIGYTHRQAEYSDFSKTVNQKYKVF